MKPITMLRKFGFFVLLLCGFIIFILSDLYDLLNWQSVANHYKDFVNFSQQNLLICYTGFVAIYTIVVALSLPIASLLTLVAGAIFGWPAIFLILLGATGSATILFLQQ